jgi:hypothetical protein
VRFNGVNRTTTFVSSTQLTAAIPAAAINTVGNFPVVVVNGTPGGGTSNAATFVVNPAPPPAITSISPATIAATGAAFTLTVNGSNFVNGSVVRINGTNRTTTFVNSTQLTAIVLATDTATAGTLNVTVFTAATSTTSASTPLTVTAVAGATPILQAADAMDFGLRRIGVVRTQTFLITNAANATAPLVISSATIGAPFTVDLGTCTGALTTGRSCKLNVTYTPTAAVLSTQTLLIFSNASGSPTPVTITGTGR